MSRVLMLVVVCLAALAVPAPAGAHPFGPPPRAQVSSEGNTVTVEWISAADDAIAVGVAVGVLPPDSVEAAREGPAQVAPPAAAEEALARSEQLRAYLLERIRVSQGGQVCPGEVAPIADFVADGARLAFTCPEPVSAVEMEITMLHDVHEAYRTFGVAEVPADPQQAVFTVDEPRHRWVFGEAAAGGAGLVWLPPLLGAAALVGGLVWLALRRPVRS